MAALGPAAKSRAAARRSSGGTPVASGVDSAEFSSRAMNAR